MKHGFKADYLPLYSIKNSPFSKDLFVNTPNPKDRNTALSKIDLKRKTQTSNSIHVT